MTTAREDTVRLADLLRREHHALAEFLIALSVFDRERRWVELGYASLFYFLTRELGLSAGAAYYRKTAAELIQKFPEVIEPLRDGRLCFTSIVELSKSLTPENRGTLLPRFFHVSKREAKAITAELQPVPDPPMRTVVTVVPSPAADLGSAHSAALSITESAFHPDEVGAATSSAPVATAPPSRQRVDVEPLTGGLRRVHLTSDRELLDLLAEARDALSHSHPGASDDAIMKVGLRLIVERHRKRRGIGAKPRRKTAASPAPEAPAGSPPSPRAGRSRYVPADVWRAVWERDGGRCAYPLENGGVCGSTHQLELDHREGFALGAGTTPEECRIVCRPHQDVHARRLYGDDLMNRYTRPKTPRCSEPVAAWRPRRYAFRHARSAWITRIDRCRSYGQESATSFPSPSPRSRRGGSSPRSRAVR